MCADQNTTQLRQSKSESNICNAILAQDAKYNHYRINNSQLRTLYIRRRNQLLREKVTKLKDIEYLAKRKFYLDIRSQILEQKYGLIDQLSVSNLSFKNAKSLSLDSNQWRDSMYRRFFPTNSSLNRKYSSIYSSKTSLNSDTSTFKSKQRTLEEIYAFAGVHHIFDHHTSSVTRVRFANNDKTLLATCSLDGLLVICQVIPSPATIIYKLNGHKAGINDMQWSSTNDLIVTASLDGTSRVWKVSEGKCMRIIQDAYLAQVLACCFQPSNENMIFTGNSKGFIQAYNLSTGILVNKNCIQKINGQVQCMCFDSMGANLWIGDNKGCINAFQFDMFTLKLNKTAKIINNNGYSITSLSFRTWLNKEFSEPTVLANAAPNYLLLYRVLANDGISLRLRKRVCIKQNDNTHIRSSFCPIISQIENVCVVCTGSEDACVYLYDMERDEKPLINQLQGHSSCVLDVCFNYDESLLASGDKQGTVIVWKRENNVKNMI